MRRLSVISHRSAVLLGTALATSLVGDDSFPAGGTVGDIIQRLRDPFTGMEAGTTTYATVGPVPAQLALSGAAIVRGSAEAMPGTAYAIGIVATSGDGRRSTMATITLMALGRAADGPVAPVISPTPTPTPTPVPTPTPTPTPAPTPTVYFAVATISATEGNSGTKDLVMTARRSTTSGAVSVTATFVQGTATAADFAGGVLPGSRTFTFADGSDTATATVSIAGDTDVESDETFGYQLVAPSGYALGSTSSLTGTILNDDVAVTPTVFFASATISATEGDSGTKDMTMTAKRSTTANAVTVIATFVQGSAGAADFAGNVLPGTKTFTFAAGSDTATATVTISGDTDVEADDTFGYQLVAPSGYALASPSSLTGTILNDDVASSLQAPIANPTTAKAVGPATATDTGWQDLGGTDHSFRAEAASSGETGSMPAVGEIYLFCDTGDGAPNCGFKATGIGSAQYVNFFYRSAGSWTQFSGGEANTNWGRTLLKEDVVDISYANNTISLMLNGVVNKTFPASVFQGKFPNGLGRYARYTRTGGTYAQKITLSGGVISPLTTRSIELDSDRVALFTFDYTGSPVGYVTRIIDGTGTAVTDWKPATLVENGTKGRATYRGSDKAPQVSVGYTYQLTEATSDGTPKSGVVPISKSIVAPGPMQFGVNVTFDLWNNNPRRNRICNFRSNWTSGNYPLNSWADPSNPQMKADFSGPTTAALQQLMLDNQVAGPLTTGPNKSPDGAAFPRQGDGTGKGGVLEIAAPRLNGQHTRFRWKGVPGNIEPHNINNVIKNVVTGTDGTYSWIDFDHTYNVNLTLTNGAPSDTINALFRYSISGGVTPTDLEAFYIDASGVALSTGYWDPDYIADYQRYVGHSTNAARMMDVQRIINMYDRSFTSAHIADGMTRMPDNGWGYEMCFSFFEATGVGGQVHIPLQADESYVRKAARIGALWSARTHLVSAWEISNEPWNSGQFTWGKMVTLGKAMGFTSYKTVNGQQVEDENGIYIKYHSYIQGLMMRWVTEEYAKVTGASQYLRRVINVQNASPANARSVFLSDPACELYTDEIQSAPYLGNGFASSFPKDVSSITDDMLDTYIARIKTEAIPTVFGNAASIRDFALSRGKSFGCYEGLLEDPLNSGFFVRLKNDIVRWPALVTYILSEYKRMVGGHYRGYYDNSLAWGFRAHVSQSPDASINGLPIAYGLKAWYDFIAAQPTI